MSRFGKSADTDAGINQLLQAEQRAKQIIKQARMEKQNRIREAREEGAAAVAELREAKQAAFSAWEREQSAVEDDETEVRRATDAAISKIATDAAAGKEEVIKFLLEAVRNVNTEYVDNSVKV